VNFISLRDGFGPQHASRKAHGERAGLCGSIRDGNTGRAYAGRPGGCPSQRRAFWASYGPREATQISMGASKPATYGRFKTGHC
jgi:hypothetical protein